MVDTPPLAQRFPLRCHGRPHHLQLDGGLLTLPDHDPLTLQFQLALHSPPACWTLLRRCHTTLRHPAASSSRRVHTIVRLLRAQARGLQFATAFYKGAIGQLFLILEPHAAQARLAINSPTSTVFVYGSSHQVLSGYHYFHRAPGVPCSPPRRSRWPS